ncbi:MAG: hypothetical protein WCH39_07395 [Schlesneria sp.]
MSQTKLNPRNEYPPAIVREAVRLRTEENLPLSAIASQLNLSRAKVRTILDREGLGSGIRGKHPAPEPPKPVSAENLIDAYLSNPSGQRDLLRQLVGGRR